MNPIQKGASGSAVEDIQNRLSRLGYVIDPQELQSQTYGSSTARAVASFRLAQQLELSEDVDQETWNALVDESYVLGDRTLYLRLPNFHGHDVYQLQTILNILGFSCGDADSYYGAHTEAAVKEFQESQGGLADGMAFQDTFDALERLHHVWEGVHTDGAHSMGDMSFSRAADVLETIKLFLTGDDPISRNIAGRIWNLARATTEKSGIELSQGREVQTPANCITLIICKNHTNDDCTPALSCDNIETLAQRLRATCAQNNHTPLQIRLDLPEGLRYDGSFTTQDAQGMAVMLLDVICTAFA